MRKEGNTTLQKPSRLNATFCHSVKQPGRYGDGRGGFGLALHVQKSADGGASKSWVQRVSIAGRWTYRGLGTLQDVPLAQARETAAKNFLDVKRGLDPFRKYWEAPTFLEATDEYLNLHRDSWKGSATEDQWRGQFERHVFPRIGSMSVARVTTSELAAVLVPMYRDMAPTGKVVRQRISAIFDWSVSYGYRQDNPARDALSARLPKQNGKVEHQRSLPHAQVRGALLAVGQSGARLSTKLAFEFLVLTAARSVEVRCADWSEIDSENRVWTVPAAKMKASKEHRVPLSEQALSVLGRARELFGGTGLVFPTPRGKALADNTMPKLLRDLKIEAVPHGFRSSFRDWCGETGVPREVGEECLAHAILSATERAYRRSDLLERRRVVMQDWGAYLGQS